MESKIITVDESGLAVTNPLAEPSLAPARGSTAPVQCGDHFNELKVDINNKMMMYAPETMTIKEADEIACAVVVMITLGKWPVR
jgi:hypothetical protein